MRWRRGLLLAVIHLCLAVPLVVHEALEIWPYLRVERMSPEEEASNDILWDVCGTLDSWPSARVTLTQASNLPAFGLSAWGRPCHSRFTIAALAERFYGEGTRKAETLLLCGVIVLIAVQWVLMGSLSVAPPGHRWIEPAWLIAGCAVVGNTFAFSARLQPIAGSLAALIWALWLLWMGLAIAKLVGTIRGERADSG